MKKYTIIIEETVAGEFEILADSEADAVEKAIQKYKASEFVLEPGELLNVRIALLKPDNDDSEIEWTEF
ncbi:MAG: hypothetical protein GX827_07635 [Clostridiales bacterium]|nr:hypothetical protein [Clostridiales bacterium]